MSINFFSGKKEFRSLSNFWEKDIVVQNRVYESGEHCFHGEKYTRLGELYENQKLIDYGKTFQKPSPYTVSMSKKKGGKNGLCLNIEQLKHWSRMCVEVQTEICRAKLQEEVVDDLRKSGSNLLIHPAMRCSDEKVKERIWEGRAIVVHDEIVVLGGNRLGNLWMKLRSKV
jgi:predicted NAD-dependent protein-ADP-ribosyltransferase YbiA (DUF1768 family)